MKEETRWTRCLRSSEHCSGGSWGRGARGGGQGLISAPFHETAFTWEMDWLWKDMWLSSSSGDQGPELQEELEVKPGC